MTTKKAVAKLLPTPGPAMIIDTFTLVVASTNELITTLVQEQRRREEIRAWEKTQLEVIHVQRDFLLKALDEVFDERRENFRRLFDQLDRALESGGENSAAQAAGLLDAITDLAKTSPFKDLKSPELFVQEFLKPGRVIEL